MFQKIFKSHQHSGPTYNILILPKSIMFGGAINLVHGHTSKDTVQ